jgi:NAD(P)-dependent dehydrogenase (short-subunit alcohol dehydrogenase family)
VRTVEDLPAIGLATAAAVAASGAWYAAFGRRLAQLHDAYAEDTAAAGWIVPVELARSGTVAVTVSALAARTGVTRPRDAVRLGLALWVAFPGVLLTGSVVHEKVPWRLAAIHAGDWLVKLLLVSLATGARRRR